MNRCQGRCPDSRVLVQRPWGHLLLNGRHVCTDIDEEQARQGAEHAGWGGLHRSFNGRPSGAIAEGLSCPGPASKTKQAGVLRVWQLGRAGGLSPDKDADLPETEQVM